MVAQTFGHGDTDPIFIQVEALGARAAVHGQEVREAALLIRAQRSASLLASPEPVPEYLRRRAALCVLICFMDKCDHGYLR